MVSIECGMKDSRFMEIYIFSCYRPCFDVLGVVNLFGNIYEELIMEVLNSKWDK